MKMFLIKSESFLTGNTTFKVHKRSEDIAKIAHVTWFNCNFTELREYFLCAKKTKIMSLFNNSPLPRQSLTRVHESTKTHACDADFI